MLRLGAKAMSNLAKQSLHITLSTRAMKHGPEGKIYRLWFDDVKNNRIDLKTFEQWHQGLKAANEDPNTVITVISGRGKFYTAGSDLNGFRGLETDEQRTELAKKVMYGPVSGLISEFIDHKKPIIALINGPCIGIGVTTLPFCDSVITSESAYFLTPFVRLGYTPEGCSSRLFAKTMGYAIASEFLVFGRKFSAAEAYNCHLVSQVLPEANFQSQAEKIVQEYANLPPQTMMKNKNMIRGWDREELKKVNEEECRIEVDQWIEPECKQGTTAFLNRKRQ
ncbi:unnamed protein product [Bursaphelenchus xylophilus]|uniref:(pine wood nematode) hypothetical protein n=1 Tax=Bursaphelenchus xylophilus TaxID=6326 RepID=A0A1I7SCA9_BURXY|nr:unnamed protein product [Bursaphelenchus xylophilus]CAG9094449.1 unnamed protein product [Bursaphelenchus xylophilus]